MIGNEKEFEQSLKMLGDLYEEGKDCLNSLSILEDEREHYHRLFDILKEMRDLAGTTMQKLHWRHEN